jgi:hypothetical protein
MSVSFHPVAFSAASTGAASARRWRRSPAGGVVDEHAVIVLQAGEQLDLGGMLNPRWIFRA